MKRRQRLLQGGWGFVLAGVLAAGGARAGAPAGGDAGDLFRADFSGLGLSAATAYQSISPSQVAALEPALVLGGEADDRATGRNIGFKAGIGFGVDPGTFLMGFQADFFLHPNIAIGPFMQFGVSDTDFFFAPTLNIQTMFDLPMDGFEQLKPVFQFGLGLIYLDRDETWNKDDGVGFLMNFGMGLEYFITDYFAVGTNLLFNVMPADVIDEHFIFGWQVITVRFQF